MKDIQKYHCIIFLSLLLRAYIPVNAQALPIGIDGKFEDWTNATSIYSDTEGDGTDFDLLSFKVSNDSNFLFIQFALDREIQLNSENNLFLEIDGDNDASTGYQVNGIGAELGIAFGTRTFYFNHNSSTLQISPYSIGFVALPTATSDTFELAINRHVLPDGTNPLFASNTIKICFKSNDYMPNYGSTFSYTFDDTPVEAYPPVSFEKINESDIRLLTYNTLFDGLTDNSRLPSFQHIITAVNPDIITFNECRNTSQYEVRNLLDSWLPLSETQWQCIKSAGGNITCSKYPITEAYSIDPTMLNRIMASVIDLPESYPRDILVINTHLKCCADDATRQQQVDAIIEFIREAKTAGGGISLPYGTPFVISGDLNLVGSSQVLTTLLTGDIVDNATFGEDCLPDWDKSALNDLISFHSDKRTATTWLDANTNYWSGRLDYAIASDVGASVNKAFTICTSEMPAARLNLYGLASEDTHIASDHLPKISDFIIENSVEKVASQDLPKIQVYPNPAKHKSFTVQSETSVIRQITIINPTGKIVFSKKTDRKNVQIHLPNCKSGIYFIKVYTENKYETIKLLL